MTNELKNQSYQEFKKAALAAEPMSAKITLSEVDIIDEQTVKVGGQAIGTNPNFVSRMVDLLDIPSRFINDYSNIMKSDMPSFINFLKNVKASKDNKEVYLLGKSNQIVGLQENYMPREVYFKTFEDIMNMKNYDIKSMSNHGNDNHIQSVLESGEFQVGSDNDEKFQPGFSFDSTEKNGISVGSYIYRLICTNGMIGRSTEEVLRYKDPEDFYKQLGYLIKTDFVGKSFADNVHRAKRTMASLAELETGRDLIRSCSSEIDPFVLERFISLSDTRALLERNKHDINLLDKGKKKNIPTDSTVWDVVNGLTDFASHDYHVNVNESDRLKLQVQAGATLSRKTYDTQNLIILNK
jgi:hypothetical protein